MAGVANTLASCRWPFLASRGPQAIPHHSLPQLKIIQFRLDLLKVHHGRVSAGALASELSLLAHRPAPIISVLTLSASSAAFSALTNRPPAARARSSRKRSPIRSDSGPT